MFQHDFQQVKSLLKKGFIYIFYKNQATLNFYKIPMFCFINNTSINNTTPTPFQGETDENFISFWSEYPKRVAKPSAVKAFQKAMKKTDLPTILIAIRKYKKTDQWRKDKGQFIPNPATWLNQERWEDETGGTSSGSLRDFF